jgi:hypothetical protein
MDTHQIGAFFPLNQNIQGKGYEIYNTLFAMPYASIQCSPIAYQKALRQFFFRVSITLENESFNFLHFK